jgi:DNA repair protein RadD
VRGKTVVFTEILAQHHAPALAVAHRIELVSQISLNLARRGLYHNIIAQRQAIREIVALHMSETGRNLYHPHATLAVAGVDTLIRNCDPEWAKTITLLVQDEAHHVLRKNKWGKVAEMFPNARGLYPTATPMRADGHGLGRHADGIIDALLEGPSMRDLINRGYLSDYRIFAPSSDIDLSQVNIGASGDYSPGRLRNAVHKSHIVGDVVSHYKRIAPGKLGVTFAVDIASATELAAAFRDSGVPAEIITGKTPDTLRAHLMRKFRNREILQIVNVDILGEGVDVPAIEVVSMARPTMSFALYAQAFGRALRPMEGKSHAIIIDHVGNVMRHGLPDAPRSWSLNRRERRSRASETEVPIKTCLECTAVYSRYKRECPFCGYYNKPSARSAPEYVDGDLAELDPKVLAKMRGEIARVDGPPNPSRYLSSIAQKSVVKNHLERQSIQARLRAVIADWAGYEHAAGLKNHEMQRKFYVSFGVDVMSAQVLNVSDANSLIAKIKLDLPADYIESTPVMDRFK